MAKTTKMKQKKRIAHESPLTSQEHLVADGKYASVSAVHSKKSKKKKSSNSDKQPSKRSQKRSRKEAQEDLEEGRLTALLFGGGGGGGHDTAELEEQVAVDVGQVHDGPVFRNQQ
ncbi:MAG: hypothetical protein SGARI_000525, partial [Bacillariaceae sp.]